MQGTRRLSIWTSLLERLWKLVTVVCRQYCVVCVFVLFWIFATNVFYHVVILCKLKTSRERTEALQNPGLNLQNEFVAGCKSAKASPIRGVLLKQV